MKEWTFWQKCLVVIIILVYAFWVLCCAAWQGVVILGKLITAGEVDEKWLEDSYFSLVVLSGKDKNKE